MVFKQKAREFGAWNAGGFNEFLNVWPPRKRVAGGYQRDAHAGILWRLGQNDVGPRQRVSVGVAQNTVQVADLDQAAHARVLRQIGHDGIGRAIGQQLRRGRAAASGGVGHLGGAGYGDVAVEQGHSDLHETQSGAVERVGVVFAIEQGPKRLGLKGAALGVVKHHGVALAAQGEFKHLAFE